MKTSKQILLICVALLIGLNLVLVGCTTAKKPLQPTPSNPVTPNATSPDQTYPADVANQATSEAEQVSGVSKATTVVSDKTIYIALDLKANSGQAAATATEKNVMNQVKSKEPGYTVWATSEIDAATRIKNIAQGIAQGQPVSNFSSELANIENRLYPRF